MTRFSLTAVSVLLLVAVTAGQTPVATIMLPDSLGGLSIPYGIWFNPVNRQCYVDGGDCIIAVAADSMRRVARIEDQPEREIAFCHPSRNKSYAINNGMEPSLLVIDGATNRVAGRIFTREYWERFCWNPATDRLYGCGGTGTKVEVLDCATDRIVAIIDAAGRDICAVCCAWTRNKVYVADWRGVLVIDGQADTVCAEIPWSLGVDPIALAFNPAMDRVYAVMDEEYVQVIDAVADTVIRLVYQEDLYPATAFAKGGRNELYVLDIDGGLWTYDCAGDEFADYHWLGELGGVDDPNSVAYDSAHEALYFILEAENSMLARYAVPQRSLAWADVGGDVEQFALDTDGVSAYCLGAGTRLWKVGFATEPVVVGVSLGSPPVVLHFSEQTRKLYSLSDCDMSLTVIDPLANLPVRVLDTREWVWLMAASADGQRLYLVGEDGMTVVDAAADTLLKHIGSVTGLTGIYPVERHAKLYCPRGSRHELAVFDCSSDSFAGRVALPGWPGCVCYSSDGDKLYVASGYSDGRDSVSVVDCRTDSVVAELATGGGAAWLCHAAACNRLYVSLHGFDSLAVFDGRADTLVDRIAVGCYARGMDYSPLHDKVYQYGHSIAGTGEVLAVIDGSSGRLQATVPLGAVVHSTLYNPVSDRLYIATQWDGVWVVDGATDSVVARVPAVHPRALAVNCRDNRVYIGDDDMSTIAVLQDDDVSERYTAVRFPAFIVRQGAMLGTRGAVLHDIAGRKVRDLAPGLSALTGITPGVYFLRERTGLQRKLIVLR